MSGGRGQYIVLLFMLMLTAYGIIIYAL